MDTVSFHDKQDIIILNFGLMDKSGITEEKMMSCVAHEIAHSYLKQPRSIEYQDNTDPKYKEAFWERDADDLAEKWGFQRAYNNYAWNY